MRKSTTEDFDVAKWAEEESTANIGCRTCANAQWASDIRKALEVWASGKGEPNLRQLCTMLRQHRGYGLSYDTMKGHVRNCETELWAAACQARRVAG